MSVTPYCLVLRTLLLLSIVCAVLCEHDTGDNRRVIIKDKGPRSHKKSHHGHGHHGRGHTRSQRHSGRGHPQGRKNKGKKQKFSSEEDGSFDASDASFSQESYEDKYHSNTVHKPHRQPKMPRLRPSQGFDYDTFRNEPYREDPTLHYHNEWMPMSSEVKPRFSSYEDPRNKRNKRKDSRPRKDFVQALRPPPVEITTSYPFQYDTPSVFPQLNGFVNPFTNWNLNQKLFQSNPPLIGTIEQPNMQLEDNSDRLKNHRTSFEEAESNMNTFISVPDDSRSVDSKEEQPESTLRVRTTEKTTTSTSKPTRSRGRANYRGNKKH